MVSFSPFFFNFFALCDKKQKPFSFRFSISCVSLWMAQRNKVQAKMIFSSAEINLIITHMTMMNGWNWTFDNLFSIHNPHPYTWSVMIIMSIKRMGVEFLFVFIRFKFFCERKFFYDLNNPTAQKWNTHTQTHTHEARVIKCCLCCIRFHFYRKP